MSENRETERAKPEWGVFEAALVDEGEDNTVVLRGVENVNAHDRDAACWMVAEGSLRERATSENPPKLLAIRTNHLKYKVYRLEQTVKRVKP